MEHVPWSIYHSTNPCTRSHTWVELSRGVKAGESLLKTTPVYFDFPMALRLRSSRQRSIKIKEKGLVLRVLFLVPSSSLLPT